MIRLLGFMTAERKRPGTAKDRAEARDRIAAAVLRDSDAMLTPGELSGGDVDAIEARLRDCRVYLDDDQTALSRGWPSFKLTMSGSTMQASQAWRYPMAAKRTTHRSSKGTKLYAVRNKDGTFKDIQSYKRAHGADLRRKAKGEAKKKK